MPEPLSVLADDTTKPSVRLSADQREALARHCAEFDGEVGLLDAGDGYVKLTFHNDQRELIGKLLLQSLYGDDLALIAPFSPS
jgi:hypothetical protein